ncbi:MAG: calcium/sodium antiporter [Pseudomonadota bacterium]
MVKQLQAADIFLTIIHLIAGLLFLYLGAEGLVRGSASFAVRLGLTRLVIGLTIIAFGTSSPELVVSVKAAYNGQGDLSLGNIIGSNICNIALILGLSSLIRPLGVNVQVVRLQIPIMIAVSLLLWALLMDGRLDRLEGVGLCMGILAYTIYSLHLARKETGQSFRKQGRNPEEGSMPKFWINALLVAGGLALLVFGANLFVSGAVSMAKILHVSQALIGLTIVAVGTSLPELATSLVAALRKEGDIAIGNVVGSNIFNILAILGISSLVRPIEMGGIGKGDIMMMILTAILTLPMAWSGFRLARWEGIILLALYGGYIYYLLPSH